MAVSKVLSPRQIRVFPVKLAFIALNEVTQTVSEDEHPFEVVTLTTYLPVSERLTVAN